MQQSVILHPASPRALAAASTAVTTHPFAAFLPPFLHPHLGAFLPATDAPQTAAFVEHVIDALYTGFGADVVDKALHRTKRQRVGAPVAPSSGASSVRAVDSPRVTEEEEADVEDNSPRALQHASSVATPTARKRRASQLEALTDANAVAGPSGLPKQAAAPAPAPSPAAATAVKPPPSSIPAAAAKAPVSSPLKAPKPPPSSAVPAAVIASEQAYSAPTSSRGSDPEDGDVSMSQQSPGASAKRRSRVRPSKRERELMKRAAAEAHAEAAQESSDASEQPQTHGDEDTQMIDETLEDDGAARGGAHGAAAGAEATDSSVVAAAPVSQDAAPAEEAQAQEAQQNAGEDEELDQLDSTPAGTPPSSRKAPNRAITRARESAASAGGAVDTPETSEDDEAEVQLSLQAHAAPASPGRRSPPRKLRDSPAVEEPDEAPLPPSAQTPAKSVERQEEDQEHLAQAANTRLPSSSPEPALPTIGSRHNDDSSSDDSSDDSDSDDDDSSSGDDHPGGSFLTGAARRLQSATGGRQSLGMVARDAFGKSRRSSLARKKPTSLGSYNPSPLKNAAVAASSSSPTKGDQSVAADDLDEIDQLMSQTQQSQRAARRTSGLNWAELEREEEERQKRKGKGKAVEDPSSEDDEADYQEAQEQLEGDEPTEGVADTVPADNDVDMAAAEGGEDASAVNGAPAEGGEPVAGSGAAVAPRVGVTGESAPITTALREDDDAAAAEMLPSSQPEPAHGLAALEPALPTQDASQFPNGARLYPDLSTIGNLASSSQTGSPPVEVDPSQVVSEDEHEDGARPNGDALPAESQFVPLRKDKPLFLETQTQADTQEPDTQFSEDLAMQLEEPKPSETLQVRLELSADAQARGGG